MCCFTSVLRRAHCISEAVPLCEMIVQVGNECSRRGTTNQSESRDHDVMHVGKNLLTATEGDAE